LGGHNETETELHAGILRGGGTDGIGTGDVARRSRPAVADPKGDAEPLGR